MMYLYTEDDGPAVTLELPIEVVRTLRQVLYRYVTPAMGIDQVLYDELGYQLEDAQKGG